MQLLAKNIELDDVTRLASLFSEESASRCFVQLVTGKSPRYDQYLKEKQEQ